MRPTSLSHLSSGDSPALPRKRQRRIEESDDEVDAAMDLPLNMRPASRIFKRKAPEESAQEEQEDEEPLAEDKKQPFTMRRQIEKHQSCEQCICSFSYLVDRDGEDRDGCSPSHHIFTLHAKSA